MVYYLGMSDNSKSNNNIKDLKLISTWLDSKFNGPFGIKFGYDAIIGLIPGIGDLFTTLVGGYVVLRAASMKVPKIILAKMGLNLLIDQLFGWIPIIGDIFDIGWKANNKNYKLVADYKESTSPVVAKAWLNIIVAVVIFLSLLILPIYLIVVLLQLIF